MLLLRREQAPAAGSLSVLTYEFFASVKGKDYTARIKRTACRGKAC